MNRLLLLTLLCTLAACEDVVDSMVPRTRVELELNTRTTGLEFEQNGYQLITTPPNSSSYIGYGGLLLIRGYTSTSEVYAFDLSCPVEVSRTVRLKVEDSHKAVCPTCGSTFDMIRYGNPAPTTGPAKEKRLLLRRYNAWYSETDYTLRVHN